MSAEQISLVRFRNIKKNILELVGIIEGTFHTKRTKTH